MSDDAEMTLIPSNTEPATGSAVAEPPKQDTTNIFGRFKKKLLFADETVVFFKHLSILGLVGGVIGTAVGSYFQYVSLARGAEHRALQRGFRRSNRGGRGRRQK